MRPWLALKHGGIDFEEVLHALPEQHSGAPAFGAISPNGRVPALDLAPGVTIAESLAICEWAGEVAPTLWPDGPPGSNARALARSASAMMHSGFSALRTDCPVNIRRRTDASRMTEAGKADAASVDAMWTACLDHLGGPFLFGRFGIVDAMYAPVVTRFVTYAIPRSKTAEAYIDAITRDPHVAAWIAAAMAETRQLPRSDVA
ncbi:MAG: glutathione S-transferase [Alphaproteobacteria bacterium]|nr:glutathione S-transferase [Alphaproteobacteria bacterium]